MVDDRPASSSHRPKTAVNGQDLGHELWKAKRFAVKFQPPCIFLEYEEASQKRRVRQVKLTRVPVDVDADRLTRKVIRSFPRQLDPVSVKYEQVKKLVVKLLDHLQQAQANGAVLPGQGQQQRQQPQPQPATTRPAASTVKALKVDAAAAAVTIAGQTPRLVPCSSPHIPAAPSDAPTTQPASAHSMESNDHFSTSTFNGYQRESKDDHGLEDLDSALNELDRELGGSGASTASRNAVTPGDGVSRTGSYTTLGHHGSVTSLMSLDCGGTGTGQAGQPSKPQAVDDAKKTRFAQEAEKLVLDVEITGDVDLNKVTEVELKLAKMRMEEDFMKNQLKPGDPGFEYDKQVEFGPPVEPNDWDESGEEEEEEEAPRPAQAPASSSKPGPGAGLRVQVDPDDDEYGVAARRRSSNGLSTESVPDDVSPNKVAIDTDSDLELDLP